MKFNTRVQLVTGTGDHIRYLTHHDAARLCALGSATSQPPQRGKIRSIVLIRGVDTHGLRIGPPTAGVMNVRFHRWVKLDCGARVVEHHPRVLGYAV